MVRKHLRRATTKAKSKSKSPYICPVCDRDAIESDRLDWVGGGYMRCRECGHKWQYKPTSQPLRTGNLLYHVAPRSARAAIRAQGLQPLTEGVYLDYDPSPWLDLFGEQSDVWQVNPEGLDLYVELDGLIHIGIIPPERLRRLSAKEVKAVS